MSLRIATGTLAMSVLVCTPAGAQSLQAATEAYVKASNTDAGDYFGRSLALSGGIMLVGAPLEDSGSVGVGADQADNSAFRAGAAYVYTHDGSQWSQQEYLKPADLSNNDQFGRAVDIDGDTAVVAAYLEDADYQGAFATQPPSDNSLASSGAVYVFVREGGVWSQQAYLKASNPGQNDHFGHAVAISGNTIVVGAPNEDSSATGVGGAGGDDSLSDAGAAYVFERTGTVWSQQAYLKASASDSSDRFGTSVDISGDTVVVGAPGESSAATGVDGDDQDDSATAAGAAYVFARNGSAWSQQAYLKASNTESSDQFGTDVAVSGDTVVVGAPREDSAASGVDGDQSSSPLSLAGAAYVFVREGATWRQQAYLKASNPDAGDEFGGSVDVSGHTIVCGAHGEDSSATGVGGDQADDSLSSSGAAYLFRRFGDSWSEGAYLKAGNAGSNDEFAGIAVAVGGQRVLAGAFLEDGAGTGVGGSGADDSATDAGAAYAYTFDSVWSDQGCALAGVNGLPSLVPQGSLQGGSLVLLDLVHAAPSAIVGLFIASASTPVPFKGGTLKPVPFLEPIILATDATGSLPLSYPWPAGVPSGVELWLQYVIQDAGGPLGFALSNAVMGLTP